MPVRPPAFAAWIKRNAGTGTENTFNPQAIAILERAMQQSATQRLADRAVFPLLVAAITGVALFGPEIDLAGRLAIEARVAQGLLLFATVVFFYSLVATLEWLHPYRREWRLPAGDVRTDVLHLLLSGPGSSAFFDATLRGVATAAADWCASRWGGSLWPTQWPAVLQLFLAILIAELGHYAFHRLSHENPWVWRLHATHHSPSRLYWLNATRFHPLDLLALITCQSVPLILLGITPEAYFRYALFTVAYGQVQHGNIAVDTRWFDWLFSTPTLHRWHHSDNPREGNTNYGAILITWDLLFGSFFRPRREFHGHVGIGRMPEFPTSYLGQLASPFRWKRWLQR